MNRALPVLVLLVMVGLSSGAALGLNLVLGAFIAPENTVSGPTEAALAGAGRPPPPAARPRVLSQDDYINGIMRRNLFDVNVIASWAPVDSSSTAGGPAAPKTDLNVRLLGTMLAQPEIYSTALILEEGKERPYDYSLGDMIYDREVVAIEKRRVTLKRGDGALEYLDSGGDAPPPAPGASSDAPTESTTSGITKVNDNKYIISQELFDRTLGDVAGLANMGRATPHRNPDGETDGFRLSSIRRDSLGDQLGIKNGDVISAVNGQSLTDMQSAMTAYNTMQNEKSFCFDVNRRGSPTQICYEVQ